MKTIKSLVKETKQFAKYAKATMPKDVSRVWLRTSQNAFLTETNPATGRRWADRYGKAFGRGFTKTGNVEPYLSYKKLRRTGRLLRSLKVKATSTQIELSNSAPYASEHETGGTDRPKSIQEPYVRGGAKGVAFGGTIHARPFMQPSKQVLQTPKNLLEDKMKKYGWLK